MSERQPRIPAGRVYDNATQQAITMMEAQMKRYSEMLSVSKEALRVAFIGDTNAAKLKGFFDTVASTTTCMAKLISHISCLKGPNPGQIVQKLVRNAAKQLAFAEDDLLQAEQDFEHALQIKHSFQQIEASTENVIDAISYLSTLQGVQDPKTAVQNARNDAKKRLAQARYNVNRFQNAYNRAEKLRNRALAAYRNIIVHNDAMRNQAIQRILNAGGSIKEPRPYTPYTSLSGPSKRRRKEQNRKDKRVRSNQSIQQYGPAGQSYINSSRADLSTSPIEAVP